MAVAIILILLVIGTLAFHFWSPWWFTPIASNWGMMDTTLDITVWVTGAVFVAVNLFMIYAIIKHRHRDGKRARYEPESKKLESWLTAITAVGVAAMLTPGLFVWADFVTVPEDAAEVEVLGQQWNWSYRLPGADGQLGETSAELMSVENPFGIDPADSHGNDDVLIASPELHLPVARPVKMLLRSRDVLHDFTVPQFRVKMDLVPGMVTYEWLTPTRTGTFDVLCQELCGLAHFAMRGTVVVDEPAAYEEWLARQPTFAQTQAVSAGDPIAGRTAFAVCIACHGPNGEGNPVLNAPRLAGQDPAYLTRQLQHFRSGLRGSNPDDTYGQQMVAFATMLDEEATRNVMAYLESLPESRPTATIAGNAERGQHLYQANCGACHGAGGQGNWATSAPRIAQLGDWYLVRQLENFRLGIRGAHPRDFFGAQMASMARGLKGERATNDVIAFINTLSPPESMTVASN